MAEAEQGHEHPSRAFFRLTPERVLEAVEASGLECTGRCQALNSYENRVYDVELEGGEHRVAKFYRPGRWTREQILEEHEFLLELAREEIPVVAPLALPGGETLGEPSAGIFCALFPRAGGRAPEELDDDQCLRLGRLLARIHTVGAAHPARHRLRLDAAVFGTANLEFLLAGKLLPLELEARYRAAAEALVALAGPPLAAARAQRIHGDCHLGNLLWGREGPFFLDFDDMLTGPPVQDVWLLCPGRDAESLRARDRLLDGYAELRDFDRSTLRLVEALRAFRFLAYSAWIARRWEDPAFPLAFPQFGTHRYWEDETRDLERQLELVRAALR